MAGSLALLLLAQLVMLLAVWSVVLLIFVVMRDSARVISFAQPYLRPLLPLWGSPHP